jgi:hypothetical protein
VLDAQIKKLVENLLSPHRNYPTPHHTTDIVFCTLKKSRHRKRANIPKRAITAKRANTANRANTRKRKKEHWGAPETYLHHWKEASDLDHVRLGGVVEG